LNITATIPDERAIRKMELKSLDFDFLDFFKPSAMKVALFITLLIAITPLSTQYNTVGVEPHKISYRQLGFPAGAYAFYEESGLIIGEDLNNLNKIIAIGFVEDVVFWYVVACIAIFAYNRFTGKGKLGEI
jgi:hypothetical protein